MPISIFILYHLLFYHLLNRFPRLVCLPEVGHAIAEDVVGMLLVVARQLDELDDLLRRLARQSLPEASHHTSYER